MPADAGSVPARQDEGAALLRGREHERRRGRLRLILRTNRMPFLLHRPATELVRLIADGTLSAVDVVTAHLERIDRLNPQLNAFVDIRRKEALAEARAQD